MWSMPQVTTILSNGAASPVVVAVGTLTGDGLVLGISARDQPATDAAQMSDRGANCGASSCAPGTRYYWTILNFWMRRPQSVSAT